MSPTPERDPEPLPGSHYTLRLAGHLDHHWSAWFDGLTLTQHHDGTTTLDGVVADQAALHALLTKVRDLGVPLLSVRAGGVAAAPDTGNTSAADADRPLPT